MDNILLEILKSLWFLLPAGIANMTPIFLKDLPFLETPIDFNYKLNGKPILGSRKTWRGLFGGIFFAIIFILVQKLLYSFFPNIYLADYSKIDVVILGFLLGFGALFGDIIKSLIKRRFNIKPGESFKGPILDDCKKVMILAII